MFEFDDALMLSLHLSVVSFHLLSIAIVLWVVEQLAEHPR